jgi:Mn-dependent DtxR family transcriptional regulator
MTGICLKAEVAELLRAKAQEAHTGLKRLSNKSAVRTVKSFRAVLKKKGRAIVVDLCKHDFEEFITEIGDIHLGFKPENICETAREYFSEVKVDRIHRISCECSGRSAEVFVAVMCNCS